MYYIVYGIFYLVSLLPFFMFHFIGDIIYLFLYYVAGYRKKIVFENLRNAFPEKSEDEIKSIAKKFYKAFIDNFLETIKLLSMSDKTLLKHCNGNFEPITELLNKGKSVQIICGHIFNWEFGGPTMVLHCSVPFIALYQKIETGVFDKIFYKIRSRSKQSLVPSTGYMRKVAEFKNKQHAVYMLADQSPTNMHTAYWLNFMGRPAPFFNGAHKASAKNNYAVVYLSYEKGKRGYYTFHCDTVIENAAELTPQQLTVAYRDFLEKAIRRQPENYLWTHRRWKNKFDLPEYEWIDD